MSTESTVDSRTDDSRFLAASIPHIASDGPDSCSRPLRTASAGVLPGSTSTYPQEHVRVCRLSGSRYLLIASSHRTVSAPQRFAVTAFLDALWKKPMFQQLLCVSSRVLWLRTNLRVARAVLAASSRVSVHRVYFLGNAPWWSTYA